MRTATMNESRGGVCTKGSDVARGRHGVNALRMNVDGGLAKIGRLLLLVVVVIELPCVALAGIVLLLLLLQMMLVAVGLP